MPLKLFQNRKKFNNGVCAGVCDPGCCQNGRLMDLHKNVWQKAGQLIDQLLSCLLQGTCSNYTSSTMQPEQHPLTERPAFQHSLRLHPQVTMWKTRNMSEMEPSEWGLRVRMVDWNLSYMILKILRSYVRYKSNASSRNPCSTNISSCQRRGLSCVTVSHDCRGEECAECCSSASGRRWIVGWCKHLWETSVRIFLQCIWKTMNCRMMQASLRGTT